MLSRQGAADCFLTTVSIIRFRYVTNDSNPIDASKVTVSRLDGFRILRMKESKVISGSESIYHPTADCLMLYRTPDGYSSPLHSSHFETGRMGKPFPTELEAYIFLHWLYYGTLLTLLIGSLLCIRAYRELGESFTFHLFVRSASPNSASSTMRF